LLHHLSKLVFRDSVSCGTHMVLPELLLLHLRFGRFLELRSPGPWLFYDLSKLGIDDVDSLVGDWVDMNGSIGSFDPSLVLVAEVAGSDSCSSGKSYIVSGLRREVLNDNW